MVYWVKGQMVARLPSGGPSKWASPKGRGQGQAEREGRAWDAQIPAWLEPWMEDGGGGRGHLPTEHAASGTDAALQAERCVLRGGVQ